MSTLPAGATAAVEVERTYDVPVDAVVPPLAGVRGVATVEVVEHALEATYYDTADLRLRAAGTTLRRRTGGADAGWHLKTPAGRDREELALPLGRGRAVPPALRALVRAAARGQALVPVAVLATRRTVSRLLDADGALLVEVADDRVTGTPTNGEPLVWREWEAELGAGDPALLDEVEALLRGAGAVDATSTSKVGRVLAASAPDAPWWASREPRPGTRTAGDVVLRHLHQQVQELTRRDPQVRRDADDAVHRMRVATRRLRSAMQTMRPLLERERTDPVRAELAWLAGLLGEARDAEVQCARLHALLDEEEAGPGLVGPVRARVDAVFDARYRAAHAEVVRALDGPRYLALLQALDGLLADPPLSRHARDQAAKRLPRVVHRAWRRLDEALEEVDAAPTDDARDLLLHEARKAAKRARYATEAVAPALGRPAARAAKAAEALTEALGEHQDGVVTREVLREVADLAHAAGEPTFTYGRLHAREQERAARADAGWPAARDRAARGKVRRWMA